jgi:deoxycytidine triphosphate deaminase
MISECNAGQIEESCKQQNATDFTCDAVQLPVLQGGLERAQILKDKTIHRQFSDVSTISMTNDLSGETVTGWKLDKGYYRTESKLWVRIPENTVGWVVQRSSLNRNGVVVMGSLYDSGYYGPIASTIYVFNPYGIFIEQGARIGQFVLAQAEMLSLYNGQYQNVERK